MSQKSLRRWSLHTQALSNSAPLGHKQRMESNSFQFLPALFLFVNNNLEHSMKTLVGFSFGSIGTTVNNAKHRHN